MSVCDNTSVGVIVTDGHGNYLLFDRNTFPAGTAPPAGHVDSHGSFEDAAVTEVFEETGLTVTSLRQVTGGWRNNRCRRTPGPRGVGHEWQVYVATVTGDLDPSPRETRNARWLRRRDLQELADRTVDYVWTRVNPRQWEAEPGIEPVWVRWLEHVGLVIVSESDSEAIDALAGSLEP